MLHTVEEVESFLNFEKFEPAVLGYFAEDNEFDIEAFVKVGEALGQNFKFGYTTSKDVLSTTKYGSSAVVLHKPVALVDSKYEKTKLRYSSSTINEASLTTFLKDKWFPLVGILTASNSKQYEALELPVLSLFSRIDPETDVKLFKYYISRLRKVADQFNGKVVFNIANPDHVNSTPYGVDDKMPKHSDTIVVVKGSDDMYFEMEGKFSTDGLISFVDSFLSGGIDGRPATTPKASHPGMGDEEEDDSDSTVVVGTDENFKDVISGKDTMLEFYAPWCGHCKHLKPEYKAAAATLTAAGVETAQFVAVDATVHQKAAEQFQVQGYPTVMFLPGGDISKVMEYNGERTSRGMIDFMKEHSVTKFEL